MEAKFTTCTYTVRTSQFSCTINQDCHQCHTDIPKFQDNRKKRN